MGKWVWSARPVWIKTHVDLNANQQWFDERVYFQKMQMQAATQAEPGGVPNILPTSNQESAMAIRMTSDGSSKMEVEISLQIDLGSHKENAPL